MLLGERICGAAPVARSYEVGVVEDGSLQRKGVAVIDQRQPIAVPAPVSVVTVLLGDQRVEERRWQAPSRIQGRRYVPRPSNGAERERAILARVFRSTHGTTISSHGGPSATASRQLAASCSGGVSSVCP